MYILIRLFVIYFARGRFLGSGGVITTFVQNNGTRRKLITRVNIGR